MRSEPRSARTPVWPLSISLAATLEIEKFSFSSSPYLDVSVQAVPLHTLWIGVWIHEVSSCGFPHSDICGSVDICSSPQLFAAYHVFHRLSVPRHPPCALFCLTSSYHSNSVWNGVCFFKKLVIRWFLNCVYFGFKLLVCFSRMSWLNICFHKYFSQYFLYEVFKVQTSLPSKAVEVASQLLINPLF